MGELNDILQRLEAVLGPLDGTPAPLDGGITNRNYRVTLGGTEYVVRRPGKDTDLLGIDREAERLANEAAAALGIAPAVAAMLEDCLVTRFITCTPLDAGELSDRAAEIGRALAAFHGCEVILPTRFSVPELLADYARIAQEHGATLPSSWAHAVATAQRITGALALEHVRPCHNDLLGGNLIRDCAGGGIMIVDWEYAGMGDPRFDLGNLSINNGFDEAADERLLTAYHGDAPSDSRRAALKLARVLSDAREGAWAVVQGRVSELDFDFAAYGDQHFERLCEASASPEFDSWLVGAGA